MEVYARTCAFYFAPKTFAVLVREAEEFCEPDVDLTAWKKSRRDRDGKAQCLLFMYSRLAECMGESLVKYETTRVTIDIFARARELQKQDHLTAATLLLSK